MECHEVLELRELHLDGDLEPAKEFALEAHLSGCARCRSEIDAAEAVARRLQDSGASIGDPAFSTAILNQIRKDHHASRSKRPAKKLARRVLTHLAAAAAAAVLAIVLWPAAGRPEPDAIVRSANGRVEALGRQLTLGSPLSFGEALEVEAAGELAFSTSSGTSFRVEAASKSAARVTPESADRLRLDAGRLSVAAAPRHSLEVESPLGSARLERSTLARVEKAEGEGLRVRVYEGSALLEQGGRSQVVGPGQEAVVDQDGPRLVRPVVEPDPDAARISVLETELEELRRLRDTLEQQRFNAERGLREALAENRELRLQLRNPPVTESQVAALMRDFESSAEAGFLYPLIAEAVELTPRFRDLGPRGIDLLAEVISSRGPSEERLLAVLILRRLETPAVIPPLQAALMIPDEADDMVRRLAAAGLSALDAESVSSILRSRFEAENEDIGVRINSAIGLARIGDQKAIDFLIGLYRDEAQPEPMREGALEALLFANRPEAAPLFRELVGDEGRSVELRAAAISFLGDVRDQPSLDLVQRIADDPSADEKLRSAAQRAYNRITGTEFYR